MEVISELFQNVLKSTAAGWVGVSGIFIYMGVIVAVALYRIQKADHMHH